MHGVAKERTIKGSLVVKGNQLLLTCDFDVPLAGWAKTGRSIPENSS